MSALPPKADFCRWPCLLQAKAKGVFGCRTQNVHLKPLVPRPIAFRSLMARCERQIRTIDHFA